MTQVFMKCADTAVWLQLIKMLLNNDKTLFVRCHVISTGMAENGRGRAGRIKTENTFQMHTGMIEKSFVLLSVS